MRAQWEDVLVNLAAHPIAWPFAQLVRTLGSVVRIPGLGVVVNDLEIAHALLLRDREFTKNGPGSIAAVMTQAFGPFALANMDGDAHKQLRSRLGDLLTPARCDALLASCRAPLDDAAARLRAGERVDLVSVTRTLSGRLTMAMIGIAATDADADVVAREIFALGERIAAALQLRPLRRAALHRVSADLDRLTSYAHDSFASEALPPASLMFRLREMGLTLEEARGVLSIFFLAGTLTAAVAMPRVVGLLIDSGEMPALHADPQLVSGAIDECLRFTTPVPATVRIVAATTDIQGHRFRQGERVVVLTSNLARDHRVFEKPHRLDIRRTFDSRGRYLWYGAGPHFCIGFPLAQREMQLIIRTLAELPGRLRIVHRQVAFGVLLPAYARLELCLDR